MVARMDVGRSSCLWGRFEVSSSLTQGPSAELGRVLVLGLLLSLENNLHICLQLLCGFFLVCAGFAHLRQQSEMPQSCSPPHKTHAFQSKHHLSSAR